MTQRLKHDQIFRKSMENPLVSHEFLATHLPKDILALMDISTVKLEKLLTSKLSQETGAKIMGSLAHHWEKIGEARGEAKGIQIGKIEVAKKMLAKGSDPAFICIS